MTTRTITLQLPESLYTRLQQAARATRRSLDDVLLHAVQVGSPPGWDDAPAEFQADLAALDRLDDEVLWRIARSRKTEADMERYQELLDKNANGVLSAKERDELVGLRTESDRFMLCKAHAAALLRWRGYQAPPAETLRDAARASITFPPTARLSSPKSCASNFSPPTIGDARIATPPKRTPGSL